MTSPNTTLFPRAPPPDTITLGSGLPHVHFGDTQFSAEPPPTISQAGVGGALPSSISNMASPRLAMLHSRCTKDVLCLKPSSRGGMRIVVD